MQIYWFGPILGGVAGGKLYDVIFINSSTVLRLLKTRLDRLVSRFSRQSAVTADAPPEDGFDGEQWSTMREDSEMWRENSLYRSRSLFVDRAVQSELTARSVAENCLAVTTAAVNMQHYDDIFSQGSVASQNSETVIEKGMLHRRHSYHQAIMHTDTLPPQTDYEAEPAVVEEVQQYALETVSEFSFGPLQDPAM